MSLLIRCLERIRRFSTAFPLLVMGIFVLLSLVGFGVMPFIKVGSSLMSGVRQDFPLTDFTLELGENFGDQDVLTVVVEFPEPPGRDVLSIMSGLAESLSRVSGVLRLRYRIADLNNEEIKRGLYARFFWGMSSQQRHEIDRLFSEGGLRGALRRNMNRAWLNTEPALQERVLEDPVELGLLMWRSYRTRTGSGVLGDDYLLLTNPDRTLYLIQITPDFLHADTARSRRFLDDIHAALSSTLPQLVDKAQSIADASRKDVGFYLTGMMAFVDESYSIFQSGIARILGISSILVVTFLLVVYRSLWACVIIFGPIACGVGPNYILVYLSYDEVNPLMMASTGVLFGLGTDYGVHLWERFSADIDAGASPESALATVFRETGPAVVVGGLTNVVAFLCLCLSRQNGISQLGWVGASGLLLTLASTLLLFPAIAMILAGRKRDYYPRMRVTVRSFSGLFQRHAGLVVFGSILVLAWGVFFARQISPEKDLFKAFIAQNMESRSIAVKINEKFAADLSQPVLLVFDADDPDEGLHLQRRLDTVLERLIHQDNRIASFDSVSYLAAPRSLAAENTQALVTIASRWPELQEAIGRMATNSALSHLGVGLVTGAFDSLGRLIKDVTKMVPGSGDEIIRDPEIRRYIAKVGDRLRFLTRVVYSHRVTDFDEVKKLDAAIQAAVRDVPVKVTLCGARQSMDEIQMSALWEIYRLGLVVLVAVGIFFLVLFRHPVHAMFSLVPMVGAFSFIMGVWGVLQMGLPSSVVAVAPLLFGLGMDNGVHVVMGSLHEEGRSVTETMERITRPILFTSITNVLGFVAMLTSRHYGLEFLGWTMLLGMAATVAFALVTLPSMLILTERWRNSRS